MPKSSRCRLLSLQDLNKAHDVFWTEQTKLTYQRSADPVLVGFALRMYSDAFRLVPLAKQPSLEKLLEIAAETRAEFDKDAAKTFHLAFSRKGGAASKGDALGKLILNVVRRNPQISLPQLLNRLKQEAPGPIVLEIDQEEILFLNGNRDKTCRISGLKDRLSRAKKQVRRLNKIESH